MASRAPVQPLVVTGDAATEHLAALGLTVPPLSRSLLHGVSQALEIDDDHPRGSAGTQMYEWATWRLRKELRLAGWLPDRVRNVEWTVEPQGRWRVVIMSGDEATGIDGSVRPHSRYPRGREGRRQVKQRIVQPQLMIPVPIVGSQGTGQGIVNHALLHYVDFRRGIVRAELSVPADYDHRGVVVEWHKRILLPVLEFDGGVGAVQTPAPVQTPPVEVRRRLT